MTVSPVISFLAAPVLHRGERVGNFFLGEKETGPEFTPEDEETLVLFASQAALVIANARRYQAGIWSVWRDPDGNAIPSCAIVTTTANGLLRPVHPRMPVILPQDRAAFWLDRSVKDPAALASVLTPYPADKLAVYAVAPLVNSVANDTPAVIAPVASSHPT